MKYDNNFAPDTENRSTFSFSAWRNRLVELKPELAFDQTRIASAEAFESWRQQVKKRLAELLYFPEMDYERPTPKLLKVEQRDGYTVRLYESYPDPWSRVRFLMLVPDGLKKPAPAVLCFPGSHHPKEALAGEKLPDSPNCPPVKFPERNCMALHYLKAGYIALAFDNPGTASTAEIESENEQTQWQVRVKLCEGLVGAGASYPAYTLNQRMEVLNFITTLPEVDNEKIAVSGHSLGSETALFMALLDDRIKALVFNDFVCDERLRWCSITEENGRLFKDIGNWHCLPGIWRSFAFPDLLAAFAPKPLALNESGAEEFLNKIRQSYSFHNADERLQISYYPKFADTPKISENVPKHGLTRSEFYEKYSSVDVPDHSFRPEPSLAFLKKVFK